MTRAAAGAGLQPLGPDEEAGWIRRIAAGDRGAFEQLYRAYQGRLFRYFVRMVGRPDQAEELANDVLVAVWKGAASYRAESKPSTWIFGIAHHKALNAQRGKRPPALELEAARAVASPDEDLERRAARESVRERLKRALAALSPEHREAVHLTFYQGLSYAEIAAATGCPVNTVKTRMFYARRRLQDLLGTMGISGETA